MLKEDPVFSGDIKRIATETTSPTTDGNGKVSVKAKMRKVLRAWCNFQPASTSQYYVACVSGISGNTASILILKEKNDGGGATALVPVTSATLTDAKLTVWFEGY